MINPLRQALEESHRDLNQWFLFHQECLLVNDDSHAELAFSRFSQILQWHLQFENEYLLTDTLTGRWPLNVYVKEHDKLLSLLEKCQKKLTSYYRLSGRYKRLALLELLDDQARFFHVMEHHEQREEQDLFLQASLNDKAFQQWQEISANIAEFDSDKESLKILLSDDIS